jgi:glutamate racemase
MYSLKPTQSIGVFDSGMGGLTVLKALKKRLPHEDFIYLGDTARLPYGTKSREAVLQYSLEMAKALANLHIKALVIACNTATTAALSELQKLLPHIAVIGVVRPGAEAVIHATQNKKIMVLATETTIQSGAYQKIIKEGLPDADIKARACSVLVALAEEGLVSCNVAHATLQHYLDSLTDQDTLLLGCTHFPVFTPMLLKILPTSIHIVDSADATANALERALAVRKLLNANIKIGQTRYFVTDSLPRFQRVGEIFLGESLPSDQINLMSL